MTTFERRIVALFACLWILPIASADSDSFTPAREGYRYQFPRDHGSPDGFRTDWWYYTGNLTTKDGRTFGYQLTFFRRAMTADQVETLPSKWSLTQLYLAHLAVSDLKNERFIYKERLSRAALGKAGAEADRLPVWIDHHPLPPHRKRERGACRLPRSAPPPPLAGEGAGGVRDGAGW